MPVDPITREELAYNFKTTINLTLNEYRVPKVIFDRVDELVRDLMLDVPSTAFEPIDPLDRGIIFFNEDVNTGVVNDLLHKLATAHLSLPLDKPITLYLNTEGGNVSDGLAINSTIHEIQRTGRVVNCHIQGVAMSMGSIIAQAATKRTIEPFGCFMLHKVRWDVPTKESVDWHQDELFWAKRMTQTMCEIFSARSGKPAAFFLDAMSYRDWHLNAKEALANGLVDEIKRTPFDSPLALTKPKSA